MKDTIVLTITVKVEETNDIISDGWFMYDNVRHFMGNGFVPCETLVDTWDVELEIKESDND